MNTKQHAVTNKNGRPFSFFMTAVKTMPVGSCDSPRRHGEVDDRDHEAIEYGQGIRGSASLPSC